MVPHIEPLEDEKIPVKSGILDELKLFWGSHTCSILPWIVHSWIDGSKVGGSHPEIVILDKEPNDTANDMSVHNDQESTEADFGSCFVLDFPVC